jgi:hypothetical protein
MNMYRWNTDIGEVLACADNVAAARRGARSWERCRLTTLRAPTLSMPSPGNLSWSSRQRPS